MPTGFYWQLAIDRSKLLGTSNIQVFPKKGRFQWTSAIHTRRLMITRYDCASQSESWIIFSTIPVTRLPIKQNVGP